MTTTPNPFQALEVKLSAGTPIEAIIEATAQLLKPIFDLAGIKRESMSQANRDRLDLLEILLIENACLTLGLVRADQLNREPAK